MSEAFICRRGGGAGLNFKVVGGTSQPTSPSENTIWVNTDTAISDWILDYDQPITRSDGTALSGGEVWLKTGSASNAAFNAVKKNGIWVYPASCNQYVNGAWVAKTVKVYQSGAWKDLDFVLFDGSLSAGQSLSYKELSTSVSGFSISVNANLQIQLHAPQVSNSWVLGYLNPAVDVSPFSRLELSTYGAGYFTGIGLVRTPVIYAGTNMSEFIASSTVPGSLQTINIDVSSISGACYLAMKTAGSSGGAGNIYIASAKLFV